MLCEESESTRQRISPSHGLAGTKKWVLSQGKKYNYKDRRTASTANRWWWQGSELTWSSRTWGELEMTKDQNTKIDWIKHRVGAIESE